MKLIIASDLHGSAKYTRQLLKLFEVEKPDKLLLLGDLLYHGPRNDLPEEYAPKEAIEMLNSIQSHILAIRGNCDSEVDQMVLNFPILAEYALLYIDGSSLYATHGHRAGPQPPPPLAKGSFLLCGHTHIGAEEDKGNYVYLNPGSLSLPKDGQHSMILYQDGTFLRKNLEGAELGRWSMPSAC